MIEEPTAGELFWNNESARLGSVTSGHRPLLLQQYIDGDFAFYMPTGGRRDDVGSVYPSYPDSERSGFSMAFNYKDLSPGIHEIKIRAYDNNDNYNDAVVSFNTERFESAFIDDPSKVNLNTASDISVLDQHTILVEAYRIVNGTYFGVDQASQTLRPSPPSGSGSAKPPPSHEDIYACVTSPDTYYSSSSAVIRMKNGLEANNYRESLEQRRRYIFESASGKWYSIENHRLSIGSMSLPNRPHASRLNIRNRGHQNKLCRAEGHAFKPSGVSGQFQLSARRGL